MLEVLIGIVVLSVGLLTVAGVQILAKKTNFDAAQKSTAAYLAQDLIARMRGNRGQLADYLVPHGSALGNSSLGSEPAPRCDPANPCTPVQLAAHDLWQWEQALDGAQATRFVNNADRETGGLASPAACVGGPITGDSGIYTVIIVWRGLSPSDAVAYDPAAAHTVADCGLGSGDYGARNQYRRVVSLSVFIA